MPVTVNTSEKQIIIFENNKNILNAYSEIIKSLNITDASGLVVSKPQLREGWLNTHIRKTVEGASGSAHGSHISILSPFRVQLDPPADILRRSYRNCLNKLLLELGLTAEQIEATKIENHFLLTRELLLRLVTVALSKDMDADRNGEIILKSIDIFTQKLLSDSFLSKDSYWQKGLTKLDKFIATTHKNWLKLIGNMVGAIKLFNQNTTALAQCLTHLNKTKHAIKCQIVAELDGNREAAEISENFIDITFESCEEKILIKYKELNQSDIASSNFSTMNVVQKTAIIRQAISASKVNVDKVVDFYALLDESDLLERTIAQMDIANSALGWMLWLTGVLQVDLLVNRLELHGIRCVQVLKRAPDDPIFAKKIGKGLVMYEAASGYHLQNSAIQCGQSLKALNDPQILKEMAKLMEGTLNGLLQIQQQLGFELIDEQQLSQLIHGVLPQSSPNLGGNSNDKPIPSLSSLLPPDPELVKLEKNIISAEESLNQQAKQIMSKYGSEIRKDWKNQEKNTGLDPIPTGFILNWLQSQNNVPPEFTNTTQALRKTLTIAKLALNKYKQEQEPRKTLVSKQENVRRLENHQNQGSNENNLQPNELSHSSPTTKRATTPFWSSTANASQSKYKREPILKPLSKNKMIINSIATSVQGLVAYGFSSCSETIGGALFGCFSFTYNKHLQISQLDSTLMRVAIT